MNPVVIRNGNSPITEENLDTGVTYFVLINVFDGNKVVLSDQIVTQNITLTSAGTILYIRT